MILCSLAAPVFSPSVERALRHACAYIFSFANFLPSVSLYREARPFSNPYFSSSSPRHTRCNGVAGLATNVELLLLAHTLCLSPINVHPRTRDLFPLSLLSPLFSFITSSYPCRSRFALSCSNQPVARPIFLFISRAFAPSKRRSAYGREFIDSRGRNISSPTIPSPLHSMRFCVLHSVVIIV